MNNSVSFALYGVADRDPDELVFMVFDTLVNLHEFARSLPGKYEEVVLMGVNYNDLTVIPMKPRYLD